MEFTIALWASVSSWAKYIEFWVFVEKTRNKRTCNRVKSTGCSNGTKRWNKQQNMHMKKYKLAIKKTEDNKNRIKELLNWNAEVVQFIETLEITQTRLLQLTQFAWSQCSRPIYIQQCTRINTHLVVDSNGRRSGLIAFYRVWSVATCESVCTHHPLHWLCIGYQYRQVPEAMNS